MQAEIYCSQCKCGYCTTHDLLQHHTLSKKHRRTALKNVEDFEISLCQIHQGCLITKYCPNCQELVCDKCILESHTTHELLTFEEAVQFFESQFLDEKKLKIDWFLEKKEDAQKCFKNLKKELKNNFKNNSRIIKNKFQKLEQVIELKKYEFGNQLKENEEIKLQDLKIQLQKEEEQIAKLQHANDLLEKMQIAKEKEDDFAYILLWEKLQTMNINKITKVLKEKIPISMKTETELSIRDQIECIRKLELTVPISGKNTIVSYPSKVSFGEPIQINLELKDKHNMQINTFSEPKFVIKLKKQNKKQQLDSKIQDLKNGKYMITLNLQKIGVYYLQIKVNDILLKTKMGQNSFQFEIEKQYNLANCQFFSPQLVHPRSKWTIQVQINDNFKKPLDTIDPIQVEMKIATPSKKIERYNLSKVKGYLGLYSIEIKYEMLGEYTITVLVDDQPMIGVPYITVVGHNVDQFIPITQHCQNNSQRYKRPRIYKQDSDIILVDNNKTAINTWKNDKNSHQLVGLAKLSLGNTYHFKFKINKRSSKNLILGVAKYCNNYHELPKNWWGFNVGKATLVSGLKISKYGGKAKRGSIVEIKLSLLSKQEKTLEFSTNGIWHGIAFDQLPNQCMLLISLYGKGDSISLISNVNI
ncbi:hypothetical protein M0812_18057 [Anaeramoeba flamelloides]|uniref:B box-type domain-containing protein n=1 Tax=Anaeramoeba flamelloides TaxID=1746091 RepID=A0AAV7Z8K0_9EUKA|nr:hypothetical protein M0812_18057 [Anaeramoeba flamelloides]